METQEIVTAFGTELLGDRATYAMTALVVHEHLSTVKYEVDFLFRRKWSASTWIFVFNRYFLLANVMFTSAPVSQQVNVSGKIPKLLILSERGTSCTNSRAMNILEFITTGELSAVPSLVFTVLRVFAILGEYSWRCMAAWILTILACATFALNSYVQSTFIWVYVNDPVLGSSCFATTIPDAVGIFNRVAVAAAIIGIVLNGLAFIITAAKTASQVQRVWSLGLGTTLSEVLLRDGSMFFLTTLILSIFNSLPTFNSNSLLSGSVGYITGPIASILPRIALSHFLINLHQVSTSTTNSSSRNFRVPNIEEVVGNLGESLEFADYRVDDEDDTPDGGAEAELSAHLDMEIERDNEDVEGMLAPARGWTDLEAGPSGSEREGVAADEQVINVQLEELRLSPVPSV